jgi:hypothetical protein
MAALSNIITPTNVLTAANTVTLTNKTISGANNTITNVSLTAGVAGTLPVANGGTGATTLTGYVFGNGTSAMTASTTIPNSATTATNANTSSAIVARDGSGNFSAGTITAALSGNASTATTATNQSGGTVNATTGSFSGTVTSTLTGTTGLGGAQVYLNGATLNRIDFNQNGVAAPAFTTRSVGAKIVLYPGLSPTAADYALGIENSTFWCGVPVTGDQFRWYGGTSVAATLSGTGNFTAVGNVTAYSDERVKTNWRGYGPDFIERLAKIKHGTFDRTDTELTQDGVSAQSLQELLPHSVMEDKEGKLSVSYGNAALVAAVKLAERVVALEARLAALEAKG